MVQSGGITDLANLQQSVEEAVEKTTVIDIHTHLYPPSFGELCSWGIDDLVTYHYLVAELFRSSPVSPTEFWALSKPQQADLIWDTLFVKNTPLSEATGGVVTVMKRLGLDPCQPDLKEARRYFASVNLDRHVEHILELANVSEVVMTNDPFSADERAKWERNEPCPTTFHRALRLDGLVLNDWEQTHSLVAAQGFETWAEMSPRSITEARRFLSFWIARLHPVYAAISLPADFTYPDDSLRTRLLHEVVLPTCLEHNLPFAMMIGVTRGANPELRGAGDSVGYADTAVVERICRENPRVRFLVTMLSRENQHALCVAARKFSNLMPFGCWWFMNTPSLVRETTTERLELLGATFIPQHSDARILEQLPYKWAHARRAIALALTDSYCRLLAEGYPLTRQMIDQDVKRMFSGNFRSWVGLPDLGAH
jgi:hypothetical protein